MVDLPTAIVLKLNSKMLLAPTSVHDSIIRF